MLTRDTSVKGGRFFVELSWRLEFLPCVYMLSPKGCLCVYCHEGFPVSPLAFHSPLFIPIDQNSADELLELSIEEVFNSIEELEKESSTLKKIIRYFGSTKLAKDNFQKLIKNRFNIFSVEKNIYNDSIDEIEVKLEAHLKAK